MAHRAADRVTRHRFARGDDSGAVAIIVAFAMTALLLAVSMVVDFGIARVDRTINKASGDSAVMAGIRSLESGDGKARGWAGVCTALSYLRVNNPEYADLTGSNVVWRTGAGAVVAGDPCSSSVYQNMGCVPGDTSTWAWMDGTAGGGRLKVQIKSGYLLTEGNFPEETSLTSLTTDRGDTVQGGCQHVAVVVEESRAPSFGSIAPVSQLKTLTRSVARVTIGDKGQAVVALVLLERETCSALSLDGSFVNFVSGGYLTRPGMIHADSKGASCGQGKIFQVEQGEARILAEHAQSGSNPLAAGVIGSVALTGIAGADPTAVYSGDPGVRVRAQTDPTTLPLNQQVPTPRPLVGREPVDDRYLAGVTDVVGKAKSAWTSAPPADWALIEKCTLDGTVNGGTVTATNVYVRCTSKPDIDVKGFTFTGGGTIVFDKAVSVANGNSLTITDAEHVFVNGGVDVHDGVLRVNQPDAATECPVLSQPAAVDTRAVMVLNGGLSASVGASVNLCSTSVVLAKCPLPTTKGTAPVDNTSGSTCDDRVAISNAAVRWLAPDRIGADPQAADHKTLEDLALWGESSGRSGAEHGLRGQGTLQLSGVFFLPNANAFEMYGGAGVAVEKAQFVVRRLKLGGTSTFTLRPDPDDSIKLPYFGDFTLVR